MVSASMGLIIFAMFRYCDPIADGIIMSKDQVSFLYIKLIWFITSTRAIVTPIQLINVQYLQKLEI